MNTDLDMAIDPFENVEALAQELTRQLDILSGGGVHEDISYGQYKVMSIISSQGPISVGNLGRFVGSAQSTTSEMVARLTKAGLVRKVRGPYDGRVVMVELTDQGDRLMRRRRNKVREAYQGLFERLANEDQNSFVGSLYKLNDILQHASG